jgi:hypothetical protein
MKQGKGKIKKVTYVRDPLLIHIVVQASQSETEKEKRDKKLYGATAPYLTTPTKHKEYFELC